MGIIKYSGITYPADRFLEQNKEVFADVINDTSVSIAFGSSRISSPAFYDNFEIVHVLTFLSSIVIQKLNERIDATKGIWRYRWGDASIRYVQLQMAFGGQMQRKI